MENLTEKLQIWIQLKTKDIVRLFLDGFLT